MSVGKKILVIDDEPHLVEMMETRLRANGYEVSTAVRGGEGLEKANQEKPDLILLDIRMPDMDGYQVLCHLKALQETKAIPVLVLSVKHWSEDIQRAIAAGAVDYIIKPFNPDLLREKIRRALGHG